MNQRNHRIYRLEGFEVDASQVCLKRNGEEQHLRQKTFQVLLYLLENRQRLVAKDELIESIWPDTAITDNALEQCLAEIRRALGDDSRNPRFIKTVPRAGYRFIGSVEEIEPPIAVEASRAEASEVSAGGTEDRTEEFKAKLGVGRRVTLAIAVVIVTVLAITTAYLAWSRTAPASLTATTLPQDPTRQSVAVMFFENQSGSADLDWLREGLADMIITGLSRSKKITVLSRQQLSVLLNRAGHKDTDKIALDQALEIARHSQAKLVVLGSFARLDEQIRIDAHLHNADDGQLLTAERLVVDQPSQILTQVDLLSLKLATYLGGAEPETTTGLSSVMTTSLEAYRYYSLGVEKAQSLRNDEAIELFQRATNLDPNFAMAYARIGYVHAVKGDEPEKGRPYLEKGYQLSDRLTEKDKLYIAGWYALANFDYPAAIRSFRQIIANYPLDVEAYPHLSRLLRGEDQTEAAMEIAKQGLVVDRESPELYNSIGSAYSDLGLHDEAIATFRRYVELAPDEPNAHDSLALGLQWAGRYPEAIEEYQRALSLKPNFKFAIIHLGNVYFQQGRYREALKQYERFIQQASSEDDRVRGWHSIGLVYLRLGKLRLAEEAGKRNLKNRKGGAAILFMLALHRGDLTAANDFLQVIEGQSHSDRGARRYSRDQIFFRGDFELKSAKELQAIKSFKNVLEHRPMVFNIEQYEDSLANAYLNLRRYDDAIAEYERILRLNPNYPLVHFHLAQAYEGKGEKDQARASFARFLEVWKDADSDIPEVMSARKAIIALSGLGTQE